MHYNYGHILVIMLPYVAKHLYMYYFSTGTHKLSFRILTFQMGEEKEKKLPAYLGPLYYTVVEAPPILRSTVFHRHTYLYWVRIRPPA